MPVEQQSTTTDTQVDNRKFNILLTAILTTAFVGFFAGIGGRDSSRITDPDAVINKSSDSPSSEHSQVPTAVKYNQLPGASIKPNTHWENHINKLTAPSSDPLQFKPLTEEQIQSVRQQRQARRAYDGAPPVVPHRIDQRHTAACLACHQNGQQIGERYATKISHPVYTNCTQCHVEQQIQAVSALRKPILTESNFNGWSYAVSGSRAWIGAPPTIPHRTLMRENCVSCHGNNGSAPIRTSHPWRTQCSQCHAPDAKLNQADFLHRINND